LAKPECRHPDQDDEACHGQNGEKALDTIHDTALLPKKDFSRAANQPGLGTFIRSNGILRRVGVGNLRAIGTSE
jgi:hypothetical protein